MQTVKKVIWGIIGCGNVTEKKSGPAFNKVNHSELRAVMRRSPGLAKDYAKRHQVPLYYDDANLLLANPDINAIYIATPPESHAYYTKMAAKAGKAVYVEKPMARSFEECLQMIDDCKYYDVPLYVAYYRRALPRFLKIKSLIDENAIGKIRYINTIFTRSVTEQDKNPENWRVNPEISGCGYFCDLASHQLNLLQYLIGPIKKVRGLVDRQAAAYPAEDAVSYQILTDNKIHINGIWNFASFKNNDQSVIVGDKGQIEFSTFENNPIVLETGSQKQEFHIEHLENIQFPLIETMVNEMRGEGECPSNGDSAAETSRLMDAILDRLIWI